MWLTCVPETIQFYYRAIGSPRKEQSNMNYIITTISLIASLCVIARFAWDLYQIVQKNSKQSNGFDKVRTPLPTVVIVLKM